MRDAASLERDARSAALLVLAGLCAAPGEAGSPANRDGPSDASADGAQDEGRAPDREPVDPADLPELPPEIKSLLGDLLADQTKPDRQDQATSSTRRRNPSRHDEVQGASGWLAIRGLPDRPVSVALGGRRASVELMDARGVLNVNLAPEPQLARCLAAMGVSESDALAIAQQIVDWRDEDDFVRPRGAEKSQHLARGVTPRNGPLRSLEELLYLPDMRREVFEMVRRGLTVEGDGRIHAGSAPVEVLASVEGVSAEAASRIVALRAGGKLDRNSLRDALGAFGAQLEASFRLDPQNRVRVRVVFPDSGAAFEGEAEVGDRDGVRILQMRVAGPGGPEVGS